jgi:tetraacyldisaccharide-1-P 4'-kinase
VRARAGTGELSLAVLEHLAGDESLLLVFAASHAIAPDSVARAIALLEGPSP